MACLAGHARQTALEACVAWLLSFIALVAGAGIILGEAGGLGGAGFFAVHALSLAVLLIGRWRSLVEDTAALRGVLRRLAEICTTTGPERIIMGSLALVALALLTLAGCGEPAVMDALTYHLPRTAQWLQDGHVHLLATSDARLNFIATVPELVWAWLLGATTTGFRPVVLAQAIGGLLGLGATVGLARQSGLGRPAALGAGALLFGMGNVVVQFTAAQTDVFTMGVFAAAFYLWLAALRRGESSALGGVGAGLALGAKGTVCYFAPTALCWVIWLGRRHPLAWREWARTIAAGACGVALFAGPGFTHNWRAYGSPLGPEPWVHKTQPGSRSLADLARKLRWNLTSSLAQNFEPQSQPAGLRSAARDVASALTAKLPARDRFTMDNLDRHAALDGILRRQSPDADVTSFGAVILLLFAGGALLALRRRRDPEARLILVWGGGVVLFFVFFDGLQQWHPFAFRYLVLAAPWLAVVAAWGIEQLRPALRVMLWGLALLATVDIAWVVTTDTHQAGWRTIVQPQRSLGFFVTQQWREWSEHLDQPAAGLVVALPEERPLAAFYRQDPPRHVELELPPGAAAATAEELVRSRPGWTIVAATDFIGREGRVMASTWLFGGNEESPYSIVAYRALRAGEKPVPVVYRHRTSELNPNAHDLLVKTWDAAPLHLALANPGRLPRNYHIITPAGRTDGQLAAHTTAIVELHVPPDAVNELNVSFPPGRESGEPPPTVALNPE